MIHGSDVGVEQISNVADISQIWPTTTNMIPKTRRKSEVYGSKATKTTEVSQ